MVAYLVSEFAKMYRLHENSLKTAIFSLQEFCFTCKYCRVEK